MAAFRPRTRFAAPLVITIAAGCSHKADPEPRTANPPAYRQMWNVTQTGGGCEARESGAHNPPAPQAVVCPPGITPERAVMVGERVDTTCVVTSTSEVTPCPLPYGQTLPSDGGV